MSFLKEDKKHKTDLVTLFKILDYHNLSDLTANHASVISDDKKSFYMNQHKYLFSQVSVKNLVKIKLDAKYSRLHSNINKAGFYIHKYIHNSKFKPKAILHTHSKNSVSISSLKKGFLEKLNQSSMRFFERVEYFDYSGMVVDEKIGKKLASKIKKNTRIIILKNHGSIILGNSIKELFHLTFHFEKCCDIQLSILNQKINNVSDKIARLTCNQHQGFGEVGYMSWEASKKKIKN